MPLSDIAQVSISTSGGSLSLPGFGTPLIAGGYGKSWLERVRTYSTLAEVQADFAVGTPEYLAAQAIFSQNPRPPRLKIGRCALPPTQRWKVVPTVSALQAYKLKVGSQEASYTSDSSPLVAEIVTGLIAAINGLSAGVTASDGTTHVVITGTAGSWQSIEALDPNLLSVEQDHADPGIVTDLGAIQLEDSDWYGLLTLWNSSAYVLAAAAWAEANEKLYVAQTQDTSCILVAEGSATDVMKAAKTAAYARTSVWYDPSTIPALAGGLLGALLPRDPGSETWALKTIAGAIARRYTGTQLANLRAKYGNWYYSLAGANITSSDSGKVAANEWIDVVRGRDALKVDMQGRIFDLLRKSEKIPYTDPGSVAVQGAIQAALQTYVLRGFIAEGSTSVYVPKVKDQSPVDRSARFFPGITFKGDLAGAIHKLSISGVLAP